MLQWISANGNLTWSCKWIICKRITEDTCWSVGVQLTCHTGLCGHMECDGMPLIDRPNLHLLFSLYKKEKALQTYWNLNMANNIVLCYVHANSEKPELFHFKMKVTLIKGCVCYIFACLFLSLNESICQTRKNTFYFTWKALFVLKKIKF